MVGSAFRPCCEELLRRLEITSVHLDRANVSTEDRLGRTLASRQQHSKANLYMGFMSSFRRIDVILTYSSLYSALCDAVINNLQFQLYFTDSSIIREYLSECVNLQASHSRRMILQSSVRLGRFTNSAPIE